MTIDRVLAAIQRTSHLTDRQMQTMFLELYEIQYDMRLEEIRMNTAQAIKRILAKD